MLKFNLLSYRLAVCRLDPKEEMPPWALAEGFVSITRTDNELSIVCRESDVPARCQAEPGWRCLEVDGQLPFDAGGVLSSISGPLAAQGISIFVVSTYDTDYVLVKDADLDRAIGALSAQGHDVRRCLAGR